MADFKYPVYKTCMNGNEERYVSDCIRSGWLTWHGRYVDAFEKGVAKYIGAKFASSTCNGTTALHLALLSLHIGPGDEVIVPSLTYVASVNAIAYTGAKPVFVDSLMDTWQMDPDDVEAKITAATKAIMAVHIYGHPCDMGSLTKIAADNNIYLIEDCAEAFGSKFGDQYAGTFGEIGVFSFYGNKTITTGEGGMLVSNNPDLIARSLRFKGQGLALNQEYWHDMIGYNYRMPNLSAAVGLAQLEQADYFISKKHQIAEWYYSNLKEVPVEPHTESKGVYHSYWMVSILAPSTEVRDDLRKHLRKNRIETRPVFFPIHTMPMYCGNSEDIKIAREIGSRGINLPSYPELNQDDVEYICHHIKNYFLTQDKFAIGKNESIRAGFEK